MTSTCSQGKPKRFKLKFNHDLSALYCIVTLNTKTAFFMFFGQIRKYRNIIPLD